MDGYEGQHTQDINIEREFTIEVSDIIADVYEALSEKGYDPVNQIVGYIQHTSQATRVLVVLS